MPRYHNGPGWLTPPTMSIGTAERLPRSENEYSRLREILRGSAR